MDFPRNDLMDEGACYDTRVGLLHPGGLACPGCGRRDRMGAHRRHRAPVLDYQCGHCGRAFNAWTGTVLQGSQRRPSQIIPILRGIARGQSTAPMARALGCDRMELMALRRRLQERARTWLDRNPLGGAAVAADEMDRNAGEKGAEHDDPDDPPRRRGNRRRGHGTFATDRPPVAGVLGRDSGAVRLLDIDRADGSEPERVIEDTTLEDTTVDTDEWNGYAGLGRRRRRRVGVSHAGGYGTWARDDDGDGIRAVHANALEGLWTGPRHSLRPFRGVSEWYLAQYVAVFQWGYNLKRVTDEFLMVLLGIR